MPFLIPVLTTTLKTMVTAFFTERVIMATCLEILKYLSRRSSNTVDDKPYRGTREFNRDYVRPFWKCVDMFKNIECED